MSCRCPNVPTGHCHGCPAFGVEPIGSAEVGFEVPHGKITAVDVVRGGVVSMIVGSALGLFLGGPVAMFCGGAMGAVINDWLRRQP